MTEAEWRTCTEPAYMAASLPFSPRKHRLFAIACSRRAAHLIHDKTLRDAIEVAERFADGGSTVIEFSVWESQVRQIVEELKRLDPGTNCIVMRGDFVHPETYAAVMVGNCLLSDARSAATDVPFSAASASAGTPDENEPQYQAEFAAHAAFVRDIFGNPFRPTAFSSAWRTSTALALAKQMYESRDFSAMPILADALQDAGCDNDDILNHCRNANQVHVRGCWVVDLVLGKE
jgi:hypothetical protein